VKNLSWLFFKSEIFMSNSLTFIQDKHSGKMVCYRIWIKCTTLLCVDWPLVILKEPSSHFNLIILEARWYIAIFFLVAEKLCFEFEGLRKWTLCRSASGVQIYIFFSLVTLRDILGTLLIMLTEWCPLSVGGANMNHTTADISANFSLRSMPFSRPWEWCFTFSTLCKTLHITSISGLLIFFHNTCVE